MSLLSPCLTSLVVCTFVMFQEGDNQKTFMRDDDVSTQTSDFTLSGYSIQSSSNAILHAVPRSSDTVSECLTSPPYTSIASSSLSDYITLPQPNTTTASSSLSDYLTHSQATTGTSSLSQLSLGDGDGLVSGSWQAVNKTDTSHRWEDVTVSQSVDNARRDTWQIQTTDTLETVDNISVRKRQGNVDVWEGGRESVLTELSCSGTSTNTIYEPGSTADNAMTSAGTLLGGEETTEADMNYSRKPRRQRMTKVYQWQPQQDPQLEKRRLRAVREHRKRQQEDQEARDLNCVLSETNQEISVLRQDILLKRQQIDALEQYMDTQ